MHAAMPVRIDGRGARGGFDLFLLTRGQFETDGLDVLAKLRIVAGIVLAGYVAESLWRMGPAHG